MRHFLTGFFKTTAVLLTALLIGFGVLQYMGKLDVETIFHKNEVLTGIDQVAAALTEEIEAGTDGIVTLYVENVSEEELMKINYNIVTLNGGVNTITRYPETGGITKVDFEIIRSDNSYAYACYVNGETIPADKQQAIELYEKISAIISSVIEPGMTDYQKELALHDYVVEHCSYSHGNPDNENEYRAYGALVEGEAVCNGYAEAMALLLSCVDINNEVITGRADDELHAWNLVEIDGAWYHLDATWDDPISREEVVMHTFFNVNDDVMEQRHHWNTEEYRSCDNMEANYFYQNHSYYTDYDSFVNAATVQAGYDPSGILEFAVRNYDESTYNLQFLFDVSGVDSVQYSYEGNENYTVLAIYLNR